MGKKTTQKNKKEKTQHKSNDGFCFFDFFFFFCPRQEDEMPSARRILVLWISHCPQPQAARAPGTPGHVCQTRGLPQLVLRREGNSSARRWPVERGNGLIVGWGHVPPGVVEPQNHSRHAQPPAPLGDGPTFCVGFFQYPPSTWVSFCLSVSSGWQGDGGRDSLCASVYVCDLYLPGQQEPAHRQAECLLIPLPRTWGG